jgi:hypothetical protein
MYRNPRSNVNSTLLADKSRELISTAETAYIKALSGTLFFIWVCIHNIGDTSSTYYVHIFFSIWEAIITYAIFLRLTKKFIIKDIMTLYKLVISIVLSISSLYGRPWWLNIFFLKNISHISDLIVTRELIRMVKDDLFGFWITPRLEFIYTVKVVKIIKDIPILIVTYISFQTGYWHIFAIMVTYIVAEFFYL